MIVCQTSLCRSDSGALHTKHVGGEPVDQHRKLGALEAGGKHTELCCGRCIGDISAESQIQRDLGLPEK